MVRPEDNIFVPEKFKGQYVEDYIEEMKAINGEDRYSKSIYSRMEHILIEILAKQLDLPRRPKEAPSITELFEKSDTSDVIQKCTVEEISN